MTKKPGVWLDPQAPRTNFILGAALSGGDPIAAAKMVADPIECETTDCSGCHKCNPPNDPKVDRGPNV